VAKYGEKAVARIREFYTWERVTEAYEALFVKLAEE
jgi:glycosyltransferase involved in cell wall biosynthesis